jgi:hypothetical protein
LFEFPVVTWGFLRVVERKIFLVSRGFDRDLVLVSPSSQKGGSGMKLEVRTAHISPIEIVEHEWVDIKLPDGRQVTVFDDCIYVATPDDVLKHKDGKKVWNGLNPDKYPYGRVGVN